MTTLDTSQTPAEQRVPEGAHRPRTSPGAMVVPPSASRHPPSPLARGVVAVALSAIAVALSVALAPYIPRTVFIFSFAAVVAAAWYGGAWPGLLVSVLCVAGVDYFVLPPVRHVSLSDPADLASLAAFFTVSALIGRMADSLRGARDAWRRAAAELAEANRQLQEQAVELEMANQQLQDQTTELEQTADELASQGAELAARTEDAERAREEADAARRVAEEANRAKSDFLATMSHELRTPLNAIGGYVQLLDMGIRGPVTPEQRDDLARIERNQRQLLGLITDVLDFAKVEAGSVAYHLEAVSLDRVLDDLDAIVAPQVAMKRLVYRDDGARRGEVVRADRQRLEQVLLNLLSNAIKFTPSGGRVEVTCEIEESTAVLRVRDTGIGIPADKLESIFQPFVQISSGFARTAEGTGLGLAISRDLARGMGGELRVESEPGTGSTFTLTVPREGGARR